MWQTRIFWIRLLKLEWVKQRWSCDIWSVASSDILKIISNKSIFFKKSAWRCFFNEVKLMANKHYTGPTSIVFHLNQVASLKNSFQNKFLILTLLAIFSHWYPCRNRYRVMSLKMLWKVPQKNKNKKIKNTPI